MFKSVATFASASISTAILLAGCAGAPSGTDPSNDSNADESSIALRLGTVLDSNNPQIRCGVEPLVERLAESDAGLSLEVFGSGQLGEDAEVIQQVVAGDVDMTLVGLSSLAEYYAPASVLEGAYVLEDADHLARVMESEIGQEITDGLIEGGGPRLLSNVYYGTRHVTANVPVREPQDLAGVPMRVIDAPLPVINAEILGADPTPLAFGEIYTALQQGVIGAQENPIPTIKASGFMEVQSHLSLTGHVVMGIAWILSEQTWTRLSESQRNELTSLVEELSVDVRRCVEEEEVSILQEWRAASDIEIVDDVNVEAFRARAEPRLLEYGDDEFDELYSRVIALR